MVAQLVDHMHSSTQYVAVRVPSEALHFFSSFSPEKKAVFRCSCVCDWIHMYIKFLILTSLWAVHWYTYVESSFQHLSLPTLPLFCPDRCWSFVSTSEIFSLSTLRWLTSTSQRRGPGSWRHRLGRGSGHEALSLLHLTWAMFKVLVYYIYIIVDMWIIYLYHSNY